MNSELYGKRPMTQNSPIRDNLRMLIQKSGMSKREICRKAGLSESSVKDIVSGKIQSPTLATLVKIADAMGLEVVDFLASPHENTRRSIAPLAIKGEVKTGFLQKSITWHEDNWREEIFPSDPRFSSQDRFAMLISDNSMSERYDKGDLIACVTMYDLAELPESGRRYVIAVKNPQGEYEVVCRELLIDQNNDQWLLAKSRENTPFAPIKVDDNITFYARVTGHWRRDS